MGTRTDAHAWERTVEQGIQTPGGRIVAGTTEPIDAATVLLLRDMPKRDGSGRGTALEVFLLERHLKSDFAGGAYAFPGGKVDAMDRDLDPARWSGIDPAYWQAQLGARSQADVVGIWVAAVRETFEEAGVLLARRDGAPLGRAELTHASFKQARARLAARGEHWDWRGWLAEERLVLDLGALVPYSWWVTPHGMHKRFDTRFFAAAVPAGQIAAHDEVETTDSRWVTPAAALADAEAGRAVVIFPTRRNLEVLQAYVRAEDVLAAGRAGRLDLRRILPALSLAGPNPGVRHPDGGPPQMI